MSAAHHGGNATPVSHGNPSSVLCWVTRRYPLPSTKQWVLEVMLRGGRTVNDVYVPAASHGLYSGTKSKLPREKTCGYIHFVESDRSARIAIWGGSLDQFFRGVSVNEAHDGHFTVEPSGYSTSHTESITEMEKPKPASAQRSPIGPGKATVGFREIPEEKPKDSEYSVSNTLLPSGDRLMVGAINDVVTLEALEDPKYRYPFKIRRTLNHTPDQILERKVPDPYLHTLWNANTFWRLDGRESTRMFRVDLQKSGSNHRSLSSYDDDGKTKKYETDVPVGQANFALLRPGGEDAKSSEQRIFLEAWESGDEGGTAHRWFFQRNHTQLKAITYYETGAGTGREPLAEAIGTKGPDAFVAIKEAVHPNPGASAKRTQEVFAKPGQIPILFHEEYNIEVGISYEQILTIYEDTYNHITLLPASWENWVANPEVAQGTPTRARVDANNQEAYLGGDRTRTTLAKDVYVVRSLYGGGKIKFPLLRTTASVSTMKGMGSPPTALLLGKNPTDRVATMGALKEELTKIKAAIATLVKKTDLTVELAKVSAATFGLYQVGSVGTGSYTIGSALGSADVYCSPASSAGASKDDSDPSPEKKRGEK